MTQPQLFAAIEAALMCTDPVEKCRRTRALVQAGHMADEDAGAVDFHADNAETVNADNIAPGNSASAHFAPDIRIPGRPGLPELVPPSAVKARNPRTREGLAALLHAVCHIEFNAINLALDAAWRFRTLPEAFRADWLRVAAEEARHFTLLAECLRGYGYAYGDFPAHNHLWDMADKTAFDPLLRMALVPRVLEARGLDVTPGIRGKFAAAGDEAACSALDVIYRDEVGHVRIGNYWFAYLCYERGLAPVTVFQTLLQRYDVYVFRGYVNLEARQEAGFSEDELNALSDFEAARQSDGWRHALGKVH